MRPVRAKFALSWAKTLVNNGLFVGQPPNFNFPYADECKPIFIPNFRNSQISTKSQKWIPKPIFIPVFENLRPIFISNSQKRIPIFILVSRKSIPIWAARPQYPKYPPPPPRFSSETSKLWRAKYFPAQFTSTLALAFHWLRWTKGCESPGAKNGNRPKSRLGHHPWPKIR